MPRIRTIKPQFWLDEDLGAVPRDARLLYIGLWNLSDDHGVFEWRPARIKVQLFPYDTDIDTTTIESWLVLLSEKGNVQHFNQNGSGDFGFIPSFSKHQEIKNPSKWRFAVVPEQDKSTPFLPQFGGSPILALPLGSRSIGSRSIGNRESNSDDATVVPPVATTKKKPRVTLTSERGLKANEVFARIDKLRGYRPPKRAAENKSVLRMLKDYTPDQIIESWQHMKTDSFWRSKELYLMSVESQIGALVNHTGKPEYTSVPGLVEEE